ncbi:unnamed protein product [Phaeothamnion confervicola]
MKITVAVAILAAFSLQTAFADTAARQASAFRSATPVAFSAEDVSRFQLDPVTAEKVEQHRNAGHEVLALTPGELAAHKAGDNNTTWIVLGIVGVVVLVAALGGGGGGGGY